MATALALISTRNRPLGWLTALALCMAASGAEAHGIAGNRLFAGTLVFDDPAIGDELVMSASQDHHPYLDNSVRDRAASFAFARVLTPTLAAGIDTGVARRNWGSVSQSGPTPTTLTLKTALYRDNLHETLAAASLVYGIGHSGAQAVGADLPNTLSPGLFIGKGFGDVSDEHAWLRPFAVTGALVAELPLQRTTTNLNYQPASNQFTQVATDNVPILHYGFALEYSPYYLGSRFKPGELPSEEPLRQLLPLIEFGFDTPRGQATRATANPGVAYVGNSWHLAAEAIVPLNSAAGSGIGARIQLLLFLDDVMPSVFGRPLLAH